MYTLAGQDSEHRDSTDLRCDWHRSLFNVSPTSLGRSCHAHGWYSSSYIRSSSMVKLNMAPDPLVVNGSVSKTRWSQTWKRACDMQPNELESLTADRQSWRMRTLHKNQVSAFEDNRIQTLQDKRARRKFCHQLYIPPDRCDTCCSRSQELVSSHTDVPTPFRDPEIRRVDGSVKESSIIANYSGLPGSVHQPLSVNVVILAFVSRSAISLYAVLFH